jgi:hypothetical protein
MRSGRAAESSAVRRPGRAAYVLLGCGLLTALAACGAAVQNTTPPAPRVGADRDEQGCIGSAGYAWCARENACVRPWELARREGFELSAAALKRYCASVAN